MGKDIQVQVLTTTMQNFFDASIYVAPINQNPQLKEIMANMFFIPPRKVRLVHNENEWYFVAFYPNGCIYLPTNIEAA